MFRLQTDQRDAIVIDSTKFGKEQRIKLENGVQTHRARLTISAPMVVTDKTSGVTINKGSVLAAIDTIKILHGGELHVYNGRQLAYLSEFSSPSQRTVVRVPATANLANTTYNLVETVVIDFAHPFSVNGRETALMEWNPRADLQLGVTVNASPTALILKSATTAALGTVTVTIQEEYDASETKLPWFQTYAEQRQITVAGTVNGASFDLPINDDEYLRGILLQEDTSGAGEQSDILSAFRLRDGSFDLISPTAMVVKDDYQRGLEHKWGGAVYDKAYTPIWFQYDARLSHLYKPNALRLFYNAAESAASGAGTSTINVLLLKCKRDLRVDLATGRRICNPAPLPFGTGN